MEPLDNFCQLKHEVSYVNSKVFKKQANTFYYSFENCLSYSFSIENKFYKNSFSSANDAWKNVATNCAVSNAKRPSISRDKSAI